MFDIVMLGVDVLGIVMLRVAMLCVCVMLGIVIPSVTTMSVAMLNVINDECQYAVLRYSECHNADYLEGERHYSECH
jgi:hypothetical protein